jgi:hypothetical protein
MSPVSSKKTSCAFETFIQSLHSAWSHTGNWEGGKNHNSAETRQRSIISPKISSEQPLVHYRQIFEKVVLRTFQNYIDERNLLNASQFGFRVEHSTTLQRMRLADHITLTITCRRLLCSWLSTKPSNNTAIWVTIYIIRIRIFDKSH